MTQNKVYQILLENEIVGKNMGGATRRQEDFLRKIFYHAALRKDVLSDKEKDALSTFFTLQDKTKDTFAINDIVFVSWSDVKSIVENSKEKTPESVFGELCELLTKNTHQKQVEDIFLDQESKKEVLDLIKTHAGQKKDRFDYLLRGKDFKRKTSLDDLVYFCRGNVSLDLIDLIGQGQKASMEKTKELFVDVLDRPDKKHTFWLSCKLSEIVQNAEKNNQINQNIKLGFAKKISEFNFPEITERAINILAGNILNARGFGGWEDLCENFRFVGGLGPSLGYIKGYKEEIFENTRLASQIEEELTSGDFSSGRDLGEILSLFPQKALSFFPNVRQPEQIVHTLKKLIGSEGYTHPEELVSKQTIKDLCAEAFKLKDDRVWFGLLDIVEKSGFSEKKSFVEFFNESLAPHINTSDMAYDTLHSFSVAKNAQGYEESMAKIVKYVKNKEELENILKKGLENPKSDVREFFRTEKAKHEKKLISKELLPDTNKKKQILRKKM